MYRSGSGQMYTVEERRIATMHALPWFIPATLLLHITSEDLDGLDAASNTDEYWHTLNAIVFRITSADEVADAA